MEEPEMTCLQVITNAGETKSKCTAVMAEARNEVFGEAEAHLDKAVELMKEAHHVHMGLITMDAAGGLDRISLILVHNEDIMMGTEITHTLTGEMVRLYRELTE